MAQYRVWLSAFPCDTTIACSSMQILITLWGYSNRGCAAFLPDEAATSMMRLYILPALLCPLANKNGRRCEEPAMRVVCICSARYALASSWQPCRSFTHQQAHKAEVRRLLDAAPWRYAINQLRVFYCSELSTALGQFLGERGPCRSHPLHPGSHTYDT